MTNPALALPLFYQAPEILSVETHAQARFLSEDNFEFASQTMAIPVKIGEFMPAIRAYPIVFSLSPEPVALVVTGIRDNRNLFVEKSVWREGVYVPAYVRRYPFILVHENGSRDHVLAADRASGRIHNPGTVGDAFFDETSKPTEFAQKIFDFCMEFNRHYEAGLEFTKALSEQGLLIPFRASLSAPGAPAATLEGFSVVDEAKYRALPTSVLSEWMPKGWCDLIALHLASQQNWALLAHMVEAEVASNAARRVKSTSRRKKVASKSNVAKK